MKTASADESGRPVQPRSLRAQIVEVLQDAIISGEYRPGQRLVEREFVTRFGVSSIPVREALQDLETRGLVVKRHNRGCSVVNLTPEQERQACAVRLQLEPTVVEWAGERYQAALHRAPLSAMVERLVAAAQADRHADYFREDMALHRFIWSLSGNEFAARALEPVVGSLFAMALMRTRESRALDLKKEADKHVQLVAAIQRGDARGAARLLAGIAQAYESILTAGKPRG